MRKWIVVIVSLLIPSLWSGVMAQKGNTEANGFDEWSDVDIFEQNKLYPRVNVVGYAYENDIEKLAYKDSPYYISLAGKWYFDLQSNVSDRPNMEMKKLDCKGWKQISVPSTGWTQNGASVKAPDIKNVLDIPDKGNPIATYYREFYVNDDWKGYEAFLQMQAKSAYYIWINKEYVGYSEDSRALSEFNITEHLHYNRVNTIAIQVVGTSDGSLLENLYARNFNGLTHDVAIVLKPEVNVSDYKISTKYYPESGAGDFKVQVSVANKYSKGLYYVEVELWTPQGKVLDKMAKWVAFDKRSEMDVVLQRDFAKIMSWSAESPNLYTMVIRLRDKNMDLVEVTGTRFGFRSISLEDGEFRVNGTPVKLRGVAYANYDVASGCTPTVEQMKKDLQLMKRYNVNAIRTSVYSPADEEFYALCDEYGFYVVCDANIQPYSTQKKAVATDGDYENLFVSRVQNMYEPLKNSTSIVMWSLGSGKDNGVCMERAYAILKQKDKNRPVIFAGANYSENTDIVAVGETDPEVLKTHAVKKQSRPILLYSFGSVKGNNFGGMESMWRLVSDNSRFLGGFVEWWNPVIYCNPQSGEDERHPGFVSDKKQIPCLSELGNMYRPIDVRLVKVAPDACEFLVSSVSGAGTLENYILEYNMFSNLKPRIVGGDVELALAPGESKTIKLKMPVLDLYIGEEVFVRFNIKQRSKTAAVPQGSVLASVEMPLPQKAVSKVPLAVGGEITLNENARVVSILGSRFSLDFDLNTADIISYKYDGTEMLSSSPRLSFSRAATDNDREDRNGLRAWMHLTDQSLSREVAAVNYRKTLDGAVVFDVMVRYKDLSGSTMFDVKQTVAVLSTADVLVETEVIAANSIKTLPRVGYSMSVPTSLDTVRWFGLENESYIDRRSHGSIGTHSKYVPHFSYEYDRPQESGNRADVRWLSLDGGGVGLFVDMVDTVFNFSVGPYTDEQLSSGRLSKNNFNVLHADFKMAGVGSSTAGYAITDHALIKDKRFSFVLHLRAFDVNDNAPEDFRRIAYPKVESGVLPMPEMAKSRDRFNGPMDITLSSQVSSAEIRYTLDGTEPSESSLLYRGPFTITSSTIVNARAYKSGYTPSFVAHRQFGYDYVVSSTFAHKPNTPYNHHQESALFDGDYGDVNDLSQGWLGFSSSDLSVVLELSKEINLETVELRFAHVPDAWAFAPTNVDVYVSADGLSYSQAFPAKITYDPTSETMNSSQLISLQVLVEQDGVRYVKVVAKNMGKIPAWHKAKGLRSWLMTDEIKLNEVIK